MNQNPPIRHYVGRIASLILLLTLLLPGTALAQPSVSGLSVEQLAGTKTMQISYALAIPTDGTRVATALEYSADGGTNWLEATGATGSVGADQPAGPGLIEWDIGAVFPAETGTLRYRVRLDVTAPAQPQDGDFLVIDLSGGPTAPSYPVSSLTEVPTGGWTDEHKTNLLVLRRLPAGTFTMGSPESELGRDGDETQHEVTLTQDFYMGVFEVTQRQWELVMGDKPSYFNNVTYYQTRPVEQVSYNTIRGSTAGAGWPANDAVDAASFIGRLRDRTGLTLDLPTESQWEYACRAGTTTALNNGQDLSSSDFDPNMDQLGRYYYNGGSDFSPGGDASVGTAAVGSYQANAWGLYDMHGNVYEWCLDWYGSYPGTVTDPQGANSGSYRVGRGGIWDNHAQSCRAAHRYYNGPGSSNRFIGFRLARSVLPADMVFVEGGTFTMGDEFGDGDSDELPLHEVTLSSFAIGRHEVTKTLWDEVATWAAANGYDISASTASADGGGGDYPAHSMTWFQMVKWCNARSEREGLTPCYKVGTEVYRTGDQAPSCDFSASGYRLPTEAEWEYAAKGGQNGTMTKYAGSDDIDAVAWYGSNSGSTSHPVGTKQANELGLYDMSGNLFEWCWDWYGSYSSASAVDPTGPGTGSGRVRRGGVRNVSAFSCRVAFRDYYWPYSSPGYGSGHLGFRLARSSGPLP